MKPVFAAALAAAVIAATALPARADLIELKWASEGYLRTRAVTLTNLAPAPPQQLIYPPTGDAITIPEIERTSYLASRLRITPSVSFANLATMYFQVDALDDVLWGDNNGVSSAPLFATDTSDQNFLGGEEQATVELHKAWVQFQVPLGIMRVGRMPSHWGMGLLANGGGNFNVDLDPTRPAGIPERINQDSFFDDDFGDNHFGSVADRILFVTKPLTIYKTITKAKDKDSKLVVGYAFDKVTEAPLLAAEPFSRQFRPFGQQGFISRAKDDIDEHVFLAIWNDPYPDFGGAMARYTDELRIGTYWVWRKSDQGSTQPSTLGDTAPGACGTFEGEGVPCIDTGSSVLIADVWAKLRYGPFYGETEILAIRGTTFGGVPFPAKNEKKKAIISGGVLRLGYFMPAATGDDMFDFLLEAGHASGDDVLEDEEFRQRSLHPDFNVGLILFEEILRELSARTYGPPFFSDENPEGATGLFSNGGVINANYLHPKVRYYVPVGGFTIVAAAVMAWVDELASTGTAMFYADETDSSYLGTEFDLAIKSRFAGHMDFSLESGLLLFGGALKSVYPDTDTSLTLQARLAFVW